MKIVVVLLACLLACVVATAFEAKDVQEYREYMAKYGKMWSEDEFPARLQVMYHTGTAAHKFTALHLILCTPALQQICS